MLSKIMVVTTFKLFQLKKTKIKYKTKQNNNNLSNGLRHSNTQLELFLFVQSETVTGFICLIILTVCFHQT